MKLCSFTVKGERLIRSCNPVFKQLFIKKENEVSEKLVIVTPQAMKKCNYHLDDRWAFIHQAWKNLTNAKSSLFLDDWRIIFKFGQQIIPGIRIFRLKKSGESSYFYLLDKIDIEAISVLNDLFFTFKIWHLIKDKMICPHGAGITRLNQSYLFLGASGAGKSTVSSFSEALGYKIVHDDHVVIAKSESRNLFLSDVAFSIPGGSLRAVFFLVQDKKDKMIALSQKKAALGLFKSLFETPGEKILFGTYLINAFKFCTEISRAIPSYELHFTKSPVFWKVIEDEKIL